MKVLQSYEKEEINQIIEENIAEKTIVLETKARVMLISQNL